MTTPLAMHPLASLDSAAAKDAAERATTPEEVNAMSTKKLIQWLRVTPNRHGKKAHSLTEISSIAGASNGWPYFILNKKEELEDNKSRFHTKLRDYAEQLAAERLPSKHGTRVIAPGRLERVVPPWGTVQKEPPVSAPARETIPQPVTEPPRLDASAVTPAPAVAMAPAGAPPLEPALKNPAGFMAEFKEITDRLWAESEALDELTKVTPAIFRPAIEKLRDDLLGVLSTMEG